MPRKNDVTVAEMVQKYQIKRGLTQEQFAVKIGVTWSTASH